MAEAAHSVRLASTRLRQEMPRAATAQQVNTQRQLAPHLMCVKVARQTPTHLRQATKNLTALATQAQAVTAEAARCVRRVSIRSRHEMPYTATAQQVNIQRQLVPHLMCVKDARQIPTHLRQATRNPTALATPAQAVTAETAHCARRASIRLRQEIPRAATAQQVNTQRQLAPHQMWVKAAR